MSATAFASYETASPAGQANDEIRVLLPSVKVKVPRSASTDGAVSYVVEVVATPESSSKSTPPVPENS